MKTNQVLVRKMGEFDVLQRTSDGMFNANKLLKQWNDINNSKKEINHFIHENKNTQEFIKALLIEENLNTRNSAYLTTRGKNGGTWMHPILFVKFAMWINPSFEVKVIKFVYDQLIRYRNDAGDAYREMTSAIATIVDKKFLPAAIPNIAKAINYIVYGNHQSAMRNKNADEIHMRDLLELEKKVATLINEGFIESYDQLINYLRKLWANKYQPKCLAS